METLLENWLIGLPMSEHGFLTILVTPLKETANKIQTRDLRKFEDILKKRHHLCVKWHSTWGNICAFLVENTLADLPGSGQNI